MKKLAGSNEVRTANCDLCGKQADTLKVCCYCPKQVCPDCYNPEFEVCKECEARLFKGES